MALPELDASATARPSADAARPDATAAAAAPPPSPAGAAVPPDVVKLGVVSFLTDLSSEMVFAVFAVYFTTVAGASSRLLGLVEGLADFSSSALSWLSGRLSDATGRRKPLALAGYAFSTAAKCLLGLSSGVASLATLRVVERLGKGFRFQVHAPAVLLAHVVILLVVARRQTRPAGRGSARPGGAARGRGLGLPRRGFRGRAR